MRIFISVLFSVLAVTATDSRILFRETFDQGLDRWEVVRSNDIKIRHAMDAEHGRVLVLVPNGDVYALIKGSDQWNGWRMEGEVLFPTSEDSYLSILYNFRRTGRRADFGGIYIKGNDSYLQVNPHRDFNVGRTLYPEFKVPLKDASAIRIGEWQRFKVEVIKNVCHFYVGDMKIPQLTYSLFELNVGSVGVQPRSVGGEVWIDNIMVSSIQKFSYAGPPRPAIEYDATSLLTSWQVMGPFDRTQDDIARRSNQYTWKEFKTDGRGAVVTGTILDYLGPKTVAYFRTTVNHDKIGESILQVSTVDDLALWVNGRFRWFIPRNELAWFDFWKNTEHHGQRIPIPLVKGENEIVLRVRGGIYATGGFFARIE
jgi:hypothetical protein